MRAVADDTRSPSHEAGDLAGRDPVRPAARASARTRRAPLRATGDRAWHRLGAVAQLDASRRGRRRGRATRAVERNACGWPAPARGPTTTRFVGASVARTYSGSPVGDAEPAALADRVTGVAAVAAEHVAREVDDLAGALARRRRGARGSGRGSCRRGSRGPGSRASPRPSRLGRARDARAPRAWSGRPSGKRRRASSCGSSAGEHVGLVLAAGRRRGRAAGRRRRPRCGRSGRSTSALAPSAVGQRQHRVEAHQAVAAHAGVRRAAGRVLGEIVVDHRLAEAVLAGRGSGAAGPVECASARAVSTACGEQQLRSPSPSWSAQSLRVTATTSCTVRAASRCAATALSTPPLIATSIRLWPGGPGGASLRARAVRQRPVQRVGREVRGVELAGRQAAELAVRPRCRDPCGVERRFSSSASTTHALPAASVAPQPSASKVTRVRRPSSTHTRDANHVAAGRAPGAADERARRARARARAAPSGAARRDASLRV